MFYDIIFSLCKKNNIKPTPLFKNLNISASSLDSWRNGGNITSNTLIKLAKYFNVSTDYLLGLSDEPNKYIINKIENTENQSELKTELNTIFDNLNLKRKTKLLTYAYDLETEQKNDNN